MNVLVKKVLIVVFFPIVLLRRKYYLVRNKYIGLHNPVKLAKLLYREKFHKELDLENPKDLNEKINWLELYSDTSQWSDLADKYKVREYIKQCGLGHMLVKLYGVWDSADKIDFDKLPDSFVLKTNNASATVILVKDKKQLDIIKVREQLNKWMKWTDFGIDKAILHYSKIKPCVIAEEYLEESNSEYSSSLIDYKFWCFNGKPYNVFLCYDRTKNSLGLTLYDLFWKDQSNYLVANHHYKVGKQIPKPESFDEMVKASYILSNGFPEVRVDFYEINGKPYFGELTFVSAAGMMIYFTKEYLLEMGNKINLKKTRS